MTESDLDRIEAALGISLPREYRDLMGRYPFDAESVAQDCAMPDDADRVIADNQALRRDGFFGVAWPAHYFTFGHNGFGDAFYLDLSRERSSVFCAQHETGDFVEDSPDLQAWVDDLAREEAAERPDDIGGDSATAARRHVRRLLGEFRPGRLSCAPVGIPRPLPNLAPVSPRPSW